MDITQDVHSVFNVLHYPCIILFIRMYLKVLINVLHKYMSCIIHL